MNIRTVGKAAPAERTLDGPSIRFVLTYAIAAAAADSARRKTQLDALAVTGLGREDNVVLDPIEDDRSA